MPQRVVVAEMDDGTFEMLGPSGVSTWPDHWGQQAADWMGLPFQADESVKGQRIMWPVPILVVCPGSIRQRASAVPARPPIGITLVDGIL